MTVYASDDELTETNASFNLFVGCPFEPYYTSGSTITERGTGSLYRFVIDKNTGQHPPAIGQYTHSEAVTGDIRWSSDGGTYFKQGVHMAWNNKGKGIFNNSDGFMTATTRISDFSDFVHNGVTYEATYTIASYYSNEVSSSIKRIPLNLDLNKTGANYNNWAGVSGFYVEIGDTSGTNGFTGSQVGINSHFYVYGTETTREVRENSGFSEGDLLPVGLSGTGVYKGRVILDNINYSDKQLLEFTPIL